jgi:hypothetical protein
MPGLPFASNRRLGRRALLSGGAALGASLLLPGCGGARAESLGISTSKEGY